MFIYYTYKVQVQVLPRKGLKDIALKMVGRLIKNEL